MAAPENLGFETPGGRGGFAAAWTFYAKQTARDLAGYSGTAVLDPVTSPSDMTAAPWAPADANISSGAATAPDGTTTANEIAEDVADAVHGVVIGVAGSLLEGVAYTFGCYLKAGTRTYGGLAIGKRYAVIDLSTGRLTTSEGDGDPVSVEVVDVGDGWWRMSLSTTPGVTDVTPVIGVFTSRDGIDVEFPGTGDTIYAWGAFFYEGVLEDVERFERGWALNEENTASIPSSVFASYVTDYVLPATYEDFETAWANYPFVTTIVLAESAVFDTSPEAYEDFEEGWQDNESWSPTITSSTAAVYTGGAAYENFESGWRDNQNSTPTIASSVAASYDGPNAQSFEDFEQVLLDRSYVAEPASDILTSGSHALTGTDVVYAVNVGGAYPGGVYKTIPYWILVINGDNLRLSKTQGGAQIDITSAGEPENYLRGDPARYWNSTGYNSTLG